MHHNLPGKKVGWHQWAQPAVFLPLEGDITIELESSALRASPGRLVYIPPHTKIRFQSSESAGERLISLLDAKAWQRVDDGRYPAVSCPAPALCRELLFHLLLHRAAGSAKSLVLAFMHALADGLRSATRPGLLDAHTFASRVRDPRVKAAIDILIRRFASTLRISEVAKQAGVSERNLSRLFMEELGHTPTEVLTHLRIGAARDLLLEGVRPYEAARRCGYKSYPSFVAVFRQLQGQLPSDVAKYGRTGEETGGYSNNLGETPVIQMLGQTKPGNLITTETTMTIEAVLRQYEQSLNANDTDAILSLYGSEPIFMSQHSQALVGREAVRAGYAQVFATIKLDIKFAIHEIQEAGEWAWARTSSAGKTKVLANGAELEEGNNELFVFRREQGIWKIHRYLFSTTTPMRS